MALHDYDDDMKPGKGTHHTKSNQHYGDTKYGKARAKVNATLRSRSASMGTSGGLEEKYIVTASPGYSYNAKSKAPKQGPTTQGSLMPASANKPAYKHNNRVAKQGPTTK